MCLCVKVNYTNTMSELAVKVIDTFEVTHSGVSSKLLSEEQKQIAAAKKDRTKFKVLYEKYFESIFTFIRRKVGDEQLTADLTSLVFLKAITKLDKFKFRNKPFGAWLYRIAMNEVYQYFRKNKKVQQVPLNHRAVKKLGDELEEENAEHLKQKLKLVIQKLSRKEVELIELRFYQNLSFREVGVILDISENNAKVRMHRLIKKLKKLFFKEK